MPIKQETDDEIIRGVLGLKEPSLDKSIEYGLKQQPKAFADSMKAAKKLNIPMDIAERQPDEVKRVARSKEINDIVKDTEHVRRALSNPDFAAVAHNDVDALTKIERTAKAFGVGVTQATLGVSESILRTPQSARRLLESANEVGKKFLPEWMTAKVLPDPFQPIEYGVSLGGKQIIAGMTTAANAINESVKQLSQDPQTFGETFRRTMEKGAKADEVFNEALKGNFDPLGDFITDTEALAGFVGQAAPSLYMAYKSGGSIPFIAWLESMEVANDAAEFEKKTGQRIDPVLFTQATAQVAGINTILEKFGLDQVFGQAGKGVLSSILKGAVVEGGTEGLQQFNTNVAVMLSYNPDKDPTEGVLGSIIGGAGTGGPIGGLSALGRVSGPGSNFFKGVIAADRATTNKQLMDTLVEKVKKTDLYSIDPETTKAFLNEVLGADNNVFINPEDAEVFFQSHPEIFETIPDESADAIRESLELGTDVVIPKSEYITYFSDYHDQLSDILRNDQDGMTAKEAEQFVQEGGELLQTEAEQMLVEQEKRVDFESSAERVAQDMKQQIMATGRFNEKVAEQYALLHKAFSQVVAQKTGKLPYEAYFGRMPTVKGTPVEGETLEQAQKRESGGKTRNITQKQAIKDGGLIVYHGSYDFKGSPSLKFYGTGEGGQGFGYGLHTSASESSAKNYAFQSAEISINGKIYYGNTKEFPIAQQLLDQGYEQTKKELLSNIEKYPESEFAKERLKILESIKQLDIEDLRKPEKVYAFYIKPTDIKYYLDYELPLRQQTTEVKNKLRDANIEITDKSGRDLYYEIASSMGGEYGGDKNASEFFDSIGIKGIRYLDQLEVEDWSDDAAIEAARKNGKYNYSTFNPATLLRVVNIAPKPNDNQLLEQKKRGTFQPGTNIISLLENADLSTFLHETGHFFLETISNMPEFQEEMDATLNWFMLDRETWNGMTFEDKREYHEQFARGFEAYLLEGKAPSLELRTVFQRFRDWLINIYRSIRNLNVPMTQEIRQVFDRLLATEEQIREAESARAYEPLFKTIEESGMTEKQWKEYQQIDEERRTTAREELQTRSLKDMKWMSNAKAKALRDIQRDVKAKRAAMRKQVADDVSRETIYQAIRFLRRGEIVQEDGSIIKSENHRLDIDLLNEIFPYGQEMDIPDWKALGHGKFGMLGKEGLDPEDTAHQLGYGSADTMIRDILDAPNQKEYIEALTDQRMLEEYGDISNPVEMERAAEEAIHNDVHTRFLHTELRVLSKDKKEKNVLAKAAKDYAEQAIDNKKIIDIKPYQFLSAQNRAGDNALKALSKGDREAAVDHKRAQVLNNHFYRAADSAKKYTDKKLTYLRKFQKEGTRKNLDPEYLEQIDDLLSSFDIRAKSDKAAIKQQTLAEFIEQQESEHGFQPAIDQSLIESVKRTHYKNMRFAEFRGMVETIEQIEHLGRLKKKLLTAKDNREFAQRIEEANRSIELLANRKVKERGTPNDVLGKAGLWSRQFAAMHRKFASIIREMDGNKNGGIMWNLLLRTMNESGDNEISMHQEATDQLAKLFSSINVRTGHIRAPKYAIPNTDFSLTDEQRLMVALNWGNEGNRQRLVDGGLPDKRQIKETDIQSVLDTLSESEWNFVQGIWDFFENYRSQIGEQEKRLTGKTPKWVDPSPIKTRYGEMKGGYFPAKYDAMLSERAAQYEAVTDLRMAMKGAFGAAATRSGYAKERAQQVKDRPLLLSFDTITQHVSEVTHRLAWQDWLTDANRVLKALRPKIIDHYGNELYQEMRESVKDIATGDTPAKNAWDRLINHLRIGTTIVGMGFRITTAAIQPTGYAQSIYRVGRKWMAKGLAAYIKHPIELSKQINEKSKLMRDRDRTMMREMNEVLTKIRGNNQLNWVKAHAFWLIQKTQRAVDVPTWQGMYERSLEEQGYETARDQAERQAIEEKSIAVADQAVIDSQAGGQVKDLARIQRGGPLMKLFTNFYSYFSATYNLNVEAFRKMQLNKKTSPQAYLEYMGDLVTLNIVPAILGALIREGLRNDCDGELECIAEKIRDEQIDFIMGQTLLTRELSGGVKALAGGEYFGYQGPAGLRGISEVGKFLVQSKQGELDDAWRKAFLNTTGIFTHLPMGQVNTLIDGFQAIENGDVEGGRTVLAPLAGPPRE